MEHITKNKKGVSMVELIAYVALYGVIMSLLASLVFTIIQAARKVNRQAILNRGATIMYTEILSQTIVLNPDSVSDVTKSADGKTISVTFEKKYFYDDEGVRKPIAESTEYADKPVKITYSYTDGRDIIDVIYTKIDNSYTTSTISLDYKMIIKSVNGENIDDVFSVDTQNTSNKYVTFHGYLVYDSKTMEFNFIIPVFTAKEE